MEIQGSISHVVFLNKDNAFTIIKVKNGYNTITAKGVFPDCAQIGEEKSKGLRVTLVGEWVKDRKYGEQFNFTQAKLNNSGLLFFLTYIVKGIGENLARRLIDEYGEKNLEDIIENRPEELLSFKGIKEKKLKKIVSSWNKHKQMKELSDFFAERDANITSNMLLRIYKHFEDKGKNAVELISENPYILTEIRGIGFKTCDKIALEIGIDKESPYRISALVDYILLSEASDSGHTYLNEKQIFDKANEYLDDSGAIEKTKLIQLLLSVFENSKYYHNDKGMVAFKSYKNKEKYIERFVNEKLAHNSPFTLSQNEAKEFIAQEERKLGFKLSKEQYDAVFDLAVNGYKTFILCGYAGTGKSTVSKIILNFFSKFIPRNQITCCAFTGMASKRIKDTTGYQSHTIHSLLGFDGTGFEYNDENKLPYNVILLDEASMVNVDIFHALIKAIKKETVFIMVGDDAQLPPIGAGNVFSDLMQYDVPQVKRKKIHRQSSDSVLTHFASYIRQGKVPQGYNGSFKDWYFHRMDIDGYFRLKQEKSEKEMKEIRDRHYNDMLSSLMKDVKSKASQLEGVKRIWDIQVITARKDSPLGTKNLNNNLQAELNIFKGRRVMIRGFLLKQYDKVIHLKNKSMKACTLQEFKDGFSEEDLTDIKVYNGNLGLVIDIYEEEEEFYVYYPDTEMVVVYTFDDYKNIIDLGYALTIHKTQGNQFKYVFIPLINSFYTMLNSKLIYTAITRAVKKVYITAQKYAFEYGCKNTVDTKRQTFLSLIGGGNDVETE